MIQLKKIRSKLLLAMMSVSALGMAILLFAFYIYNANVLENHLNERIQTQINFFAKNLGPALVFNDEKTANDILATLTEDHDILNVILLDTQNQIFAEYSRNTQEKRQINTSHLSSEVLFANERAGQVKVSISTERLTSETNEMLIYALAIFALGIFASYSISLWIEILLSKPILRLNSVSKAVTESKNYNLRADIDTQDEIGELGQQFNLMLTQISQRDKMLERAVSERTHELEKLANEFRYRAYHDNLTGLRNRAYLNEYFDRAVLKSKRQNTRFLMLLLDLDNFKTINDNLGHDAGDELLKLVADRLVVDSRDNDLVIRLGGDEFIMLVENIEPEIQIDDICESIINRVRQNCQINGRRLQITVSIGGAIFPEHGNNINILKRNADLAMYEAKALGRNQYCLYQSKMGDSAANRLIVQNDLRSAIDDGQLTLHYQPKVNAKNHTVVGCEALVRWQHPDYGLLMPDSFIAISEESGLIKELDYYVLQQACRQMADWQQQHNIQLSTAINLSGQHFSDHKIIHRIEWVLAEHNIPAHLLGIEVTEAILIGDVDNAMVIIQAIRDLGVSVSLDDFGTGYSSLSYLRQLPVNTVKLDREFICNVLRDPKDAQLTEGIINLANSLGLNLIAEGVETQQQEQFLLKLGCEIIQGNYYLKPSPPEDLISWIQSSPLFQNKIAQL